MPVKKTGLLFPDSKKSSRRPPQKKSPKKTSLEDALTTIHEAKDRQSRSKIITELAHSDESWVCDVLIQALDDPCEDIREHIITELANRENLDIGLLRQQLHQTPWYVKTGCLRILGLQKNPSSIKYIENLVNDPNIEVRRTLAIVLGEIGGEKALALLAKLSDDASCFVRKPALRAIQDISQVKFS